MKVAARCVGVLLVLVYVALFTWAQVLIIRGAGVGLWTLGWFGAIALVASIVFAVEKGTM